MNLNQLQPKTKRMPARRVGRGGKRGTYSGKGMKGQKSRAGAGFKPGFRGGDNRLWQLFPKQRGASKKPGGKGPHRKHRFFRLNQDKPVVFNLGFFNQFAENEIINLELLNKKGFIANTREKVKVLGSGELTRKLEFHGFKISKSAQAKIVKAKGVIK